MMGLRVLLIAALCGSGLAHPGEHHDAAKRRRDLHHNEIGIRNAEAALLQCKSSVNGQAMARRAALRRAAKAAALRGKRDIEHTRMKARQNQNILDEYLQTCHDQTGAHADWSKSTPHGTIFGTNSTIGLAPETIIGPYWVHGESIRSNIVENQDGIPVHLDLQFVDTSTCAPVPNMLVDVWHANATGVYSGVVDGAGLNTTFLRGVQLSDNEGVANFDTVFPGHYLGRVNHIHVTTNRGGKVLENGTYIGGTVNHIGQLYFDQELINAIEGMSPYSRNQYKAMYNTEDFLTAQQASRDYDPFLDYIMLSEDPNDGLLMYMTIGINGTADYDAMVSAGAWYYREGGVDTSPRFNFTIPPGGFPFPTGFPSGFPTGFPTSFPSGFPTGFPSGFPTGFPGGFPGGFPPMPTGTPPKFWGPCMKKKKPDTDHV
ncbi:Intradiol ring-cleavage dioxygenase [Xylaria bambusicola]|uniref:Intradiol ring-cleavage dioxygenase n=1 Tax=Xylaria bambusicola TaxID=326684 RepID=UPI0020073061|nr:Intradiol ring-cleavage dioxygenase [Xylaria bambusicola]KAI0523664.1 Intradiol ring-cleavage dioxygenase [Xylaria bambusicola]